MDSLKAGVAEIALFTPAMFASAFPLVQITSLPTIAMHSRTNEEARAAFNLWWDFYAWPEVQKEFAGMKMLWPCVTSTVGIASAKKEIRAASDFKGLVMSASGESAEVVKAFGGASVMVVPPQGYMNFDKGLIDAGFFAPAMITDYGTQDLLKYYNAYPMGTGILVLMMNIDVWNAMSAQDQKILESTMLDASQVMIDMVVPGEHESLQMITDAGVKIIEPTLAEIAVWDADCQVAIDSWAKKASAVGYDAEQLLAKYREMRKQYIPR
jgi:TRAP-type C4-dicarboxylate transport system substrate-binding protein